MSKLADKKLKLTLLIVGIFVILITAGVLIYFIGLGAVDSKDKEPVSVNIPNGSGASAIVEILDEQGLVKNKLCAKIHIRMGGYDTLQANTYVFSKSMSLPKMFKAINKGDFKYISKQTCTIIEGTTLPQVAEAMAKELPFTADEILSKWATKDYLQTLVDKYWFITDEIFDEGIMYPLEGYIYPETYFITDEEPTIEGITETMLEKTDQELSKRKGEIKDMGYTVHEFLTLASIVENESLFDDDRPKIAGVFINRLQQGMPLQSDITVLYALQEKRVDVTYEDLEVDSKYNTYKNPGIPIGPVCAVPARTMDDVINYEKTDYLFFFATKDGKVIYSQTLAEHEKAVKENKWY